MIAATAGAATAVLVVGCAYAATSSNGSGHETLANVSNNKPAATSHHPPCDDKAKVATPVAPLKLVSVTPAGGAHGANGAAPITVKFSARAVAADPAADALPVDQGQLAGIGGHRDVHPRDRVHARHDGEGHGPRRRGRHAARGRVGRDAQADVGHLVHHRLLLHPAAAAAAHPARLPAADLDAERPVDRHDRRVRRERPARRGLRRARGHVHLQVRLPEHADQPVVRRDGQRPGQRGGPRVREQPGPHHGRRRRPAGLGRPAQRGRQGPDQPQRLQLRARHPGLVERVAAGLARRQAGPRPPRPTPASRPRRPRTAPSRST